MARIDFINQLNALGYSTQELSNSFVVFEYAIPIGRNSNKLVDIAFQVTNDFPMNCPPGPHFKSIGIEGWCEPRNNIHASPLGNDWRYWSRPFPDWNRTERSAKSYMAHIKNLLAKL
jgi:hypothetical protein